MSKLTQRQYADKYHVSQYVINKLNEKGIDLDDESAVIESILNQRSRPKQWINGVPWEQEATDDNPHLATSAERDLMEQVRTAVNYDEARTLKTKIDGIHKLRQIEILEGDYIHKEEVMADLTSIGAAVAAAHRQCQADLPAMLEGLTAAKAKSKIREYMLKIDAMLADEAGKLYKQQAK